MTLLSFTPDDSENGDVATRTSGTAGVQSDTEELKYPAVGFLLRVNGDIKVTTLRGKSPTLTCLAGIQYSLGIKQVWDTGTTVTNAQIVLFYGRLPWPSRWGWGWALARSSSRICR
jgi:hypothetical protein